MTKDAHAEDIKALKDEMKGALVEVVKLQSKENQVLHKKIELESVGVELNQLLDIAQPTRQQLGRIKYLEKRQDVLIEAIDGS